MTSLYHADVQKSQKYWPPQCMFLDFEVDDFQLYTKETAKSA